TANITLGNFRLINVGDAVAGTDALNRNSGDARYSQRPASSTDNAVARFDGTTGALQNSSVLIDDSNVMSGLAGISGTGPANGFRTGDDPEVTDATYTTTAADLGKWKNITHATGCTVTLHDS